VPGSLVGDVVVVVQEVRCTGSTRIAVAIPLARLAAKLD
jgi:hypothetical protein